MLPHLITATTTLVVMVGSPIAQAKSPGNFNRWFAERGLDLTMLPIDLQHTALPAFIATLRGWQNLRGCVVTVPYKQAVVGLLDQVTERAALLGAVNVIRREADGRLLGDNVDGAGFIGASRAHGFEPAGARALVLGAGGVGSAICHALCAAGLRSLVLTDPDSTRAAALARLLRQAFPSVEIGHEFTALADFNLVANASPVGMDGSGELPLPVQMLATLQPGTLVADVVTSPPITAFLEQARAAGAIVQAGAEIARAQMGDLGHFMGVMPLDV
jgi:shikimate dehydrogenase